MDAKPQPAAGVEKETDDIYFSADEMIDNKDMQTITAVGDVNIIRKDQTLKADKVIYNQKDDIVTAVGNVSIVQADGTVVFSDYVELDDKMTKGHMTDVRIIMKDETRIAASKFRKMANDNKVMENVVYSPCDVCRSKDPLWQIKARKVKHDAKIRMFTTMTRSSKSRACRFSTRRFSHTPILPSNAVPVLSPRQSEAPLIWAATSSLVIFGTFRIMKTCCLHRC